MRKPMMFIVMMFVLAIAVGCSQPPAAEPAIAAGKVEPTRFAPARTPAGVVGSLAPRDFVELSVTSNGIVSDVLAMEGNQVQAGQVLVRLNDTRLKLAVDDARLKLSQAELNLAQTQKPTDPAHLAAAQQAVRANQLALASARAVYSSTIDSAQIAKRNAQLAFDLAQRAYSHDLDLQSWGKNVQDALETHLTQLNNARSNLGIAQRDADNAPVRASQTVAQAQQVLAASQAAYEALNGLPAADQVQAAQLAVESAQLALEQAEANLDDALVRAPGPGVVAEVQLKVGQSVAPGTRSVTLADTGGWVVDTPLTELSVVDLQQGQRAKVKFDAIPGLEMTGHIESISLRGQDQQGNVIYIARVALDGSDPRLRWGMGTLVQFEKSE